MTGIPGQRGWPCDCPPQGRQVRWVACDALEVGPGSWRPQVCSAVV